MGGGGEVGTLCKVGTVREIHQYFCFSKSGKNQEILRLVWESLIRFEKSEEFSS